MGGFAAQSKGWTWTIWGLMWLSGFTLILLIFFLHETSVANILYRRARRLRELTGQTDLSSEAQIGTEELKFKGSFFAIPLRSSVPTKRCPGSCIRDLM
jgi:MFS transporter, DHA1 family, multidrug resistance protein